MAVDSSPHQGVGWGRPIRRNYRPRVSNHAFQRVLQRGHHISHHFVLYPFHARCRLAGHIGLHKLAVKIRSKCLELLLQGIDLVLSGIDLLRASSSL
jgi:hypothetical protein